MPGVDLRNWSRLFILNYTRSNLQRDSHGGQAGFRQNRKGENKMTRNKTIDNSEDIIDSWDVIARIYDLESERGGLVDAIESAKNELVEFETAHPEWALVGEDSESREYLHDTLTNA